MLGADILPNAKGNNGTDIDFRATFPDGVVVSVECVSKKYNQEAQTEIDRNADMANMLDEVGPHLWAISFRTLPKAMTTAEFQPYVDRATEFYATLPTAVDGGDHIPYEWMGEHGLMRLEALPFPRGTRANHMGAGVSWVDDSILRLKDALIDSHKRKQARGAYPPVFLAIDCPFNGPDAEDFDGALFGTSVDHRGFDLHESVGESLRPDGMFVTDKDPVRRSHRLPRHAHDAGGRPGALPEPVPAMEAARGARRTRNARLDIAHRRDASDERARHQLTRVHRVPARGRRLTVARRVPGLVGTRTLTTSPRA